MGTAAPKGIGGAGLFSSGKCLCLGVENCCCYARMKRKKQIYGQLLKGRRQLLWGQQDGEGSPVAMDRCVQGRRDGQHMGEAAKGEE